MGFIGDSYFNYAATGTSSISLTNNSVTDSYKTNAIGTHPVMSGAPWERGNIITNGTEGAITINDSTVKGHATIGPGGDPATGFTLVGTGKVLYDKKVNTGIKRVPRYVPPFDPAVATAPAVYDGAGVSTLPPGGYTLLKITNGATVRMGPGNYYFHDSFTVNGSNVELDPSVSRDNPCSVYVGKAITVTNSSYVNLTMGAAKTGGGSQTAGPMTLRFFFVGNGAPGFNNLDLKITKSKCYFVAAGKGMRAVLDDGAEIFGSLKGYTIAINNGSKIHYDKDLFGYLNMGTVAWNLQGLTTDSGDVMEDGGMGGGDAGGDAGGGG